MTPVKRSGPVTAIRVISRVARAKNRKPVPARCDATIRVQAELLPDIDAEITEFEVQAFLYHELRAMGYTVRGEITSKCRTARLDLLVYRGVECLRIIEVKKKVPRKPVHTPKSDPYIVHAEQIAKYSKFGLKVDLICSMEAAVEYLVDVKAGRFDREVIVNIISIIPRAYKGHVESLHRVRVGQNQPIVDVVDSSGSDVSQSMLKSLQAALRKVPDGEPVRIKTLKPLCFPQRGLLPPLNVETKNEILAECRERGIRLVLDTLYETELESMRHLWRVFDNGVYEAERNCEKVPRQKQGREKKRWSDVVPKASTWPEKPKIQ